MNSKTIETVQENMGSKDQDGPVTVHNSGYSTAQVWEVFRREVAHHVVVMQRLLRTIVAVPNSRKAFQEMRRTAHTLKGTAGTMGFPHVANLAHRIEDALDGTGVSPVLQDTIRVLEELSAGSYDAVTVVTSTATKPLAVLEPRLHQIVRHAAEFSGKQVKFVVENKAVELEPELWNDVSEILLHLLRNAVEHGIEIPELRTKHEKPPVGAILVTATCEHSRLILQVIDDGHGIDPERIRYAAVERGLVTEEKAAQLTHERLFDLLLKPGFTTARATTELAGRGMGLDVVNTRVTRRKGSLLVESEPGRGTCVMICIRVNVTDADQLTPIP